MLRVDILEQVRGVIPGFNRLPASSLEKLRAEGVWGESPAGQVLLNTDKDVETCILLIDGRVRIVLSSEEGRELVLFHSQAGDPCALMASCLLGHDAFPARVETETVCKYLKLPQAVLLELTAQSDEFREFVLNSFAARIADLITAVKTLAFAKLESRLASALLQLGDDIQITHQILAAEIGSVREVVSRTLKTFEAKSLVRLSRSRIEVINRPGLELIAQAGEIPEGPHFCDFSHTSQ